PLFAATKISSSADARKISAMRPSFMAPLYHEEKRGPGDFPGPRHYGSEVLEGVADPRCDRRHVLRIVLWTEHARRNAVDVGRAQSRRRLGQRGLVGIADPHVTAAQIEREPRREPPGDPGVQFSTQVAAPAVSGATDSTGDDAVRSRLDTVRVDSRVGPALHDGTTDREGGRQRVARAYADTLEAVLVVTDGERRRQTARAVGAGDEVEVIDTEGLDFGPARPELGVGADRLEEARGLPRVTDIRGGLVTGRVASAPLEEQRASTPATRDVEQPRAHILLLQRTGVAEAGSHRGERSTTAGAGYGRAVGGLNGRGDDEGPVTPLIEDGRVEIERPRGPLCVEAHGVTVLDRGAETGYHGQVRLTRRSSGTGTADRVSRREASERECTRRGRRAGRQTAT